MLRFPKPSDDHEAWFEERYAQILAWAEQITGRDREQAEDLVHDVFVQFVVRRPDLTTIQNPEGYLYTSLRHHHLANARRTARLREIVSTDAFDLLAHDSLPQGIRAWQAQRLPGAHEPFAQQLREVWRYTQQRKHTAKTASVLLLRFFYGYYPGEIAQLLRLSRPTVGQLLHLARKEARLFMADPDAPAPRPPDTSLFNPSDLVIALRDAALSDATPRGAARREESGSSCPSEDAVAALYDAPDEASVPVTTVAHLVSCRCCLDRANRAIGLPPLADRHPLDSLGYDRDDTPTSGGSSGTSGTSGTSGGGGPRGAAGGGTGSRPRPRARQRRRLDEGRRRLADLRTHRPQELRIAVNGIVLGSQAITAAVSRQTFRVAQPSFDFLEVLSEQDVRLLLVSVEPPPRGPVDVRETVELEDGRHLDVRIDFSSDTPSVQVSYVDHALAERPVRDLSVRDVAARDVAARDGAARDVSTRDVPARDVPALDGAVHHVPAHDVIVPHEPRPTPRRVPLRRRVFAWIRRLTTPAGDAAPRRWRLTRGGAFTTLVVATIIGAALMHQFGQSVLSAAELLERSRAAEILWRSSQTGLVHRTLEIEVRALTAAAPIRQRVEVWHSGPRGLMVRRAYDEQGRLIGGEWIDASGTRTVYRQRGTSDAGPALGGLEAWRLEPSADDFLRIAGNLDRAVVRREASRYVIAIGAEPPTVADAADGAAAPALAAAAVGAAGGGGAAAVTAASLTLRGDDWRAIAQRATVRSGAATIDVSWIERTRTIEAPEHAPVDPFEVDAALTTAAPPSPPAVPVTRALPRATADLEIGALAALRRIDADLGEEVRVQRANGRLSVTGIVASAQRRAQILAVLGTIARDPAADVRIETLDEIHARVRRRGTSERRAAAASRSDARSAAVAVGSATAVGARSAAVSDATRPDVLSFGFKRIPLHDEVRAALIAGGADPSTADADVARTAERIIRRAQAMRLHAWALRRVLDGLPAAEADPLTPAARTQWRALVAEHGRAFLDEAHTLSALVRPVLSEAPNGGTAIASSVDAAAPAAAARSAAAGAPSAQAVTRDAAALDAAADRALERDAREFVDAAGRLDALVQSAFMLPMTAAPVVVPSPRAFWASFDRAATAAARLTPVPSFRSRQP